ncbi:hypothetical protein [Actinomadura craniellae]|uniref:hypothetical protein n=1 Tax=Actinomadura craniellae TaxID=2231787 RepID=UPI0011BEFAB2|nr:hypothetical protein [Actinomadura craniellae]
MRDTTRILVLGWVAAIAVLAAKLLGGKDTIGYSGIELNVRHAWVLLAVISLMHVFKGLFIVRHLQEHSWGGTTAEEDEKLFKAIRAEGNPLVHGLRPRRLTARPVARMDPADPSYWAAYLFQIMTFVAVLPWAYERGHVTWPDGTALWLPVLATLVFLGLNWQIGSRWLAAVGDLQPRSAQVQGRPVAPVVRGFGMVLALVVFAISLPGRIILFPFLFRPVS